MRRLTLRQNPHFYQMLPTLPEAYGGDFRMEPIETFQHGRVSVLIDNPNNAGRVFLETERETRAFGNVWVPNEAIVFKGSYLLCRFSLSDTSSLDVCGNLEGESIIEVAIKGIPNLWCFEERLPSLASQMRLSDNWNTRTPTVTATKITSAKGILIRDWREPIRRMLQSRDVNIRITDKPPSSSGSSDSYTSYVNPIRRFK
ncbi:hypothetical protein BJV77DRAFT_97427 [Russula vinacea]|nr:hypothetical protein BJV77DRAFT_97427 [Russula vinacea]